MSDAAANEEKTLRWEVHPCANGFMLTRVYEKTSHRHPFVSLTFNESVRFFHFQRAASENATVLNRLYGFADAKA